MEEILSKPPYAYRKDVKLLVKSQEELYKMYQNSHTKNLSVKLKRELLYKKVPEQPQIGLSTIYDFSKKELGMSHKRITIYEHRKFINKEVLIEMYRLIQQKVKEGYIFASLDECGFGSRAL
jgi:hypothetical protein